MTTNNGLNGLIEGGGTTKENVLQWVLEIESRLNRIKNYLNVGKLIDTIADYVYDDLADGVEYNDDHIASAILPPDFLNILSNDIPEFRRGGNWLGYYSMRKLADAVVASRDDIELIEGEHSTGFEQDWEIRLKDGVS